MNHTFSLPAIKSLKDLCHAAILNFKGLAKKNPVLTWDLKWMNGRGHF